MPNTIFMESGTDATQDFSFFDSTSTGGTGTISSATDQSYTGPRSIKSVSVATDDQNTAKTTSIFPMAGGSLSIRLRLSTVTPSSDTGLVCMEDEGGDSIIRFGIATTGVLQADGRGVNPKKGLTSLSANQWYRVTMAWVVTSTTSWSLKIYLNGKLEIVTNNGDGSLDSLLGTLFNLSIGIQEFGGTIPTWGVSAPITIWYDDIYGDDRTDQSDTGDYRIIAKRSYANGTTNEFNTQIGSGGSSYGSGHAPQVNERPLSTTNGWSFVGAGPKTEEYNIENRALGDYKLSGRRVVDFMGWVYASAALSETGKIIVNGVSTDIALTSTPKMFTKVSGSASYPAGSGTDIGISSDTTVTTVSLYECGILICFDAAILF